MKTPKEIEQLAEKEYPLKVVSVMEGYEDANRFERDAFKKAYTQCQEDMADKKYTEEDMRQAMIIALVSNSVNGSKDIDDYINSLNKQD